MLITELGYFSLLLALVLAMLQAILPAIGVIKHQVTVAKTGTKSSDGTVLAMAVSFLALIAGFYIMILA